MSLEQILYEKEHELEETRSMKFKLWFAQRLAWTYVKSVWGFLVPNALVPLTAGIIIGLITPSNVPEKWMSSMIGGGFLYLIFGGLTLYIIKRVSKAPLSKWYFCAVISGILCGVLYVLLGFDDLAFLINAYVIFTFVLTPIIFMHRRVSIIRKDIKSMHLTIASLKQQILEKDAYFEQKMREREAFEEEMKKKGFVSFVNINGEEKWGKPEQVKEWKRIDIGLKNRFADYSPREFEKFVARLFYKMGYEVSLGSYVGDYGADIIAYKGHKRLVIQVKKYAQGNLVGNRDVRDTLGALWNKGDKAILVTTSDFTEQAYQQAKGAPIELWNYQTLAGYVEKYLVEENVESASVEESIDAVEEEGETDSYREAFPELSDVEAELQETQEVDMDSEDEEDCTYQADCPHHNVIQSVFNVKGEPRRIVKKCEDCGKILDTVNIGR